MTDTLIDLIPEDAKLSPKMKGLSEKAKRFVIALVELGGRDMNRAAMMAGYEGSPASMNVTASRLAADPRVQAALLEEAKALMASSALSATATMIQIMENPIGSARDRLSAAKMVLAFAGMEQAAQVSKVEVSITEDRAEQIAQVKAMAAELGLDPRKLLGKAGVTIDAEFTEVKAGTEGLEDIL
jgi:phage terminase small subunit